MIKAIIFDFDRCIFDTPSMGAGVIDLVLAPLRSSALPQETKDAVLEALMTEPLHMVLERFSIPEAMGEAMRSAYANLVLPPGTSAATYGDEGAIGELPVLKLLVTTGYRKFQQSKIDRVGIVGLFNEVIIDVVDDPHAIKGKKKIFEELLAKYALQKDEVLVVGDNPRSELGAAQALGITAVQTLRPGVAKWEEADHHIAHLSELSALLK